jgi:hypothetical protein
MVDTIEKFLASMIIHASWDARWKVPPGTRFAVQGEFEFYEAATFREAFDMADWQYQGLLWPEG